MKAKILNDKFEEIKAGSIMDCLLMDQNMICVTDGLACYVFFSNQYELIPDEPTYTFTTQQHSIQPSIEDLFGNNIKRIEVEFK